MKINLAHVQGDLGLEFPDLDNLALVLKSIVNGSGTIAIGKESTHLSKINIDETSLHAPAIQFPDGHLHLENDVPLHNVILDLTVGKNVSGRAEIKSGLFEKITLKHLKHACSFDLDLRGMTLELSPEGLDLKIASATVKALTYNADGIALNCKQVRLESFRFTGSPQRPKIEVDFISCDSIECKMPSKQVYLKEATLDKGLVFSEQRLTCPTMSVDNIECNLETIAIPKGNVADKGATDSKPVFNDAFLGGLTGNIHTLSLIHI